MRTILVTGAAGFIGSCFVRQLLATGDTRVVSLDKLNYAGSRKSLADVSEHPAHQFVQADTGDAKAIAEILGQAQPDAIVNLAAETHVDRSIDGPTPFVQTNVLGTQSLLDCVLGWWERLPQTESERFRFLHVSTDEVFGSLPAGESATETAVYAPSSPYAASKAAADHFVGAYHQTYGLPTIITRASNNYGPRQFPEKLIPLMTLNALSGKSLPVYGDGGQIRDWMFVEDHCRALRAALARGEPGESYNIGAGCQRTNLQVVQAICDIVDELHPAMAPSAQRIEHVVDRPGHDRRYSLDTTKARRELGWKPEQDFESALRATVSWYAEHAEWVQNIGFDRVRLGLGKRS